MIDCCRSIVICQYEGIYHICHSEQKYMPVLGSSTSTLSGEIQSKETYTNWWNAALLFFLENALSDGPAFRIFFSGSTDKGQCMVDTMPVPIWNYNHLDAMFIEQPRQSSCRFACWQFSTTGRHFNTSSKWSIIRTGNLLLKRLDKIKRL